MNEEFDFLGDGSVSELVNRFEEMVTNNQSSFFDVDDFELIIEYYFERNNLLKTQIAIEHAIDQHPKAVIFQVKKAQYYVSSNKAAQALRLLADIETIDPSNTEIFMTKAAVYSQLKQFNKAIEEYEKALNGAEEEKEDIYHEK